MRKNSSSLSSVFDSIDEASNEIENLSNISKSQIDKNNYVQQNTSVQKKDDRYQEFYIKWQARRSARASNKTKKPQTLYDCQLCNQIYTAVELKRHQAIHERNQGKFIQLKKGGVYKCLVCSKSNKSKVYKLKSKLLYHLSSHDFETLKQSGYPQIGLQSEDSDPSQVNQELFKQDESSSVLYIDTIKAKPRQIIHQKYVNARLTFEVNLNDFIKKEIQSVLEQSQDQKILKLDLVKFNQIKGRQTNYKFEELNENLSLATQLWTEFKFISYLNQKGENSNQDKIVAITFDNEALKIKRVDWTLSLAQYLRQEGFQQNKKIFSDIVDAVAQLHKAGIIHRFLSTTTIKVMNQDNSKVLITNFKYSTFLNVKLDASQMPITIYQDQKHFDEVENGDNRQDIYSLLVILLEILIGKKFVQLKKSNKDLKEIITKIREEKLLPKSQRFILNYFAKQLHDLPNLQELKQQTQQLQNE